MSNEGLTPEERAERLMSNVPDKLHELEKEINARVTMEVKGWDSFKLMRSEMLRRAGEDMRASASTVLEGVEKMDSIYTEQLEHDWELYENRHELMMNKIIERHTVALDDAGSGGMLGAQDEKAVNGKVSDSREWDQFLKIYETDVAQTDMMELLLATGEGSTSEQQGHLTEVLVPFEKAIPRSVSEVRRKLVQGERLNEQDLGLLRVEMDFLMEMSQGTLEGLQSTGDSVRYSSSLQLMNALQPMDRFDLVHGMLGRPDMDQKILGLTKCNFLLVSQAEELLEQGALMAPNDERAFDFLDAKDELFMPDTREDQEILREFEKKNLDYVKKTYGHFNRVQRLATVKGLFALWLTADALATGIANFGMMAMQGDIVGMATNPGVLLGFGVAAGTTQVMDGFGVLNTLPLDPVANVLKDRNEEAQYEESEAHRDMNARLGNDPYLTRFYYEHAEKIEEVYIEQKKKGVDKPEITFDELGYPLDTDIPEELQGRDITAMEDALTKLNRDLREDFAAENSESQMDFIDAAHQETFCLGSYYF